MRETALLKIIFLSIAILFSKISSANNVAQNDQPYFSFKTGNYNFIFPKNIETMQIKLFKQLFSLQSTMRKYTALL